jgi:hypothetical protein
LAWQCAAPNCRGNLGSKKRADETRKRCADAEASAAEPKKKLAHLEPLDFSSPLAAVPAAVPAAAAAPAAEHAEKPATVTAVTAGAVDVKGAPLPPPQPAPAPAATQGGVKDEAMADPPLHALESAAAAVAHPPLKLEESAAAAVAHPPLKVEEGAAAAVAHPPLKVEEAAAAAAAAAGPGPEDAAPIDLSLFTEEQMSQLLSLVQGSGVALGAPALPEPASAKKPPPPPPPPLRVGEAADGSNGNGVCFEYYQSGICKRGLVRGRRCVL